MDKLHHKTFTTYQIPFYNKKTEMIP